MSRVVDQLINLRDIAHDQAEKLRTEVEAAEKLIRGLDEITEQAEKGASLLCESDLISGGGDIRGTGLVRAYPKERGDSDD